ncbi:MAG: polysaccharide biosynthesis tyrosine autokinase [Sphingobium sp.]
MSDVLAILRRRWLLIATIVVLIFGACVVGVMMMTPKYEAVAYIKIDPSPSAAVGQLSAQSSIPDQAIVDTEVSVMQSLDVARGVVQKLDLLNDPEFAKGDEPRTGLTKLEEARRLDEVAGSVLGAISARREKSTYIVELGALSVDAAKAARIANAFAAQYLEASLRRRTGTAEREVDFLDRRLKALNDQANAASQQLAEYKARNGVIGGGGGSATSTDQQIAPLSTQYATAQSEAAAAAAKLRSAEQQIRSGGLDSVSAVLNSDVIRNLRQQRAGVLDLKSEVLTRYGPKHPETQKVNEQLAAIDGQLTEEARRIVEGLKADAAASSARAASLASELEQLRGKQSQETRSSATADIYQRQADSAQAAYDRLAEKAQISAQAAGSSISQAQIIEQATPPLRPSKPNKRALLAVGLLGALFVAFGAVTAIEIVNSGLMSIDEVENLGIHVLGTVPKLAGTALKDVSSPADYLLTKPVSFYGEAYRAVRGTLMLGQQSGSQVIAIVSTLPDEGKTTSSLSLARIMALAGESTIVVDCDLRRAGLTELAGIKSDVGLVEILKGEASIDSAIHADAAEKLSVLPLSSQMFSPEDLFSGDAMLDLIAELRKRYQHVILDTPPLLGVIDARMIAAMADNVVMIVKWNATPRQAVKSAKQLLDSDHTSVTGAVLSMVEASFEAYGAMYYSKKYADYYHEK